MALIITKYDNINKFNHQFLIYYHNKNFGINVNEYVMNQWTSGHDKEYIFNKLAKIKHNKIISDEFVDNVSIDSFTIEEFIQMLIDKEMLYVFSDEQCHFIKY